MSHSTVHPMEFARPVNNGPRAENAVGVRMRDVLGMPGTPSSLILRLFQFVMSVAVVGIMGSDGFRTNTAFSYLVVVVGVQSLWSLSLVIVHICAILVGRELQNFRIANLFITGDEILATLTFTAASASAGMTAHIRSDIHICAITHCQRFELATVLAFISWFPFVAMFVVNYWTGAVKMMKRR